MKRNRLKIRFWLTMAFAAVPLAFASSASAMLNSGDPGGPSVTTSAPVVANPSGFAWADATIGAAVALALALIVIGLAYVARSRSRFAPSH